MKHRSLIFIALFMLAITPLNVHAKKTGNDAIKAKIAMMTQEQKIQEAAMMQERVKAIRAMDFSKMSAGERRNLRQELKSMKKEAKLLDVSGGVYISFGALILIIVLLIILL
jgi:hypothetical protein